MLRLIKGGKAPTVPVVPGPDGATRGDAPPCVACEAAGDVIRVPILLADGSCAVVCLDGHECGKRYRRGASPSSYAAALRGEILGVAP